MIIDLEITRPLLVSQGDTPDKLLIEMRFSSAKDINGASLPEIVFKMESMPRQFGSAAEAEAIQEAATTSTATTGTFMGSNAALNLIISASLN